MLKGYIIIAVIIRISIYCYIVCYIEGKGMYKYNYYVHDMTTICFMNQAGIVASSRAQVIRLIERKRST